MSESTNPRKSAALKKLAEHLAALNRPGQPDLTMENDMLPLIVSETLNAEDISQRYPAFHRQLLENAELRQAFLDALELLEAERAGELTPIPAPETRLDFLIRPPSTPKINIIDHQKWSIIWQKTLEQIQSIFSPPDLAYRAEQNLIEEPWFTLLRDEIPVAGVTYSITLDCTLAPETENELAASLSLAVTPGAPPPASALPLTATLQWGAYQKRIIIPAEGRARFPNIPLEIIFDPALEHLQAGLTLTLETVS